MTGKPLAGAVLTLNAGSSSLKFAVFDDAAEMPRGQVSGIGTHPKASAARHSQALDPPALHGATHEGFLPGLLDWIGRHVDGGGAAAAGHRVVHGGTEFVQMVRIRMR